MQNTQQTKQQAEETQAELIKLTLTDLKSGEIDLDRATVEIEYIISQAIQSAEARGRQNILEKWKENHPQESLEKAMADSLKHGGVNSAGFNYDRGYLDCHNQVIIALTSKGE